MICSVDKCENKVKVHSRSLCAAHYARYVRQGESFDRSKITNVHKTLQERMAESFVINENGCHDWIKGRSKKGYGVIGVGSRLDKSKASIYAHRASYEMHKGKIPEGYWVLHHCDRPQCINPDHLFLGNAKDNTKDMYKKGRAANKTATIPNNFIKRVQELKRMSQSL